MTSSDGDCSGGHDQNLLATAAAPGDVVGESIKPVMLYLTVAFVDQQRRSDLDDEAARGRELLCAGCASLSAFFSLTHGRHPSASANRTSAPRAV